MVQELIFKFSDDILIKGIVGSFSLDLLQLNKTEFIHLK